MLFLANLLTSTKEHQLGQEANLHTTCVTNQPTYFSTVPNSQACKLFKSYRKYHQLLCKQSEYLKSALIQFTLNLHQSC